MALLLAIALGAPFLLYLFYLYVEHNDCGLSSIPPIALASSPHRYTLAPIEKTAERLRADPINIKDVLPPKTGRKYIIVGGVSIDNTQEILLYSDADPILQKAGFLGGWLVVQLLMRGESPQRIRVLDIRAPTRLDLTTGRAKDVDFRIVNVTDADAVNAAFLAPWPDEASDHDASEEVTVFHTAANIRFYERARSCIPFSANVNVKGTQNILNAAKRLGVSTLVYTSSGSVSIRRTRFWLWPWQKVPERFVQFIDDDDSLIPKKHSHFFSNYAYSKSLAESLVRGADKSLSGSGTLRTGCLRPGNGIFGPGGDVLCGAYLVRKTNPTWISHILQNFIYVENCALAHLCYERRLIDIARGAPWQPDIGGQAFCVTDPCPPITYGDVYRALTVLTRGETTFPELPITALLAVSHVFELWYLARHYLLLLPRPMRWLARAMPPLGGDLVNLQPSLFALTMVHLIFDDSRARKSPEDGGLGYVGQWTTLEGLCKLVEEHEKGGGRLEERQKSGGGVGFGLIKAGKMAAVGDAPTRFMN